jgi:hypothetical protein
LHRSLFEPPEDESAETSTHDSNAIPEVSEPPSPEDNDGDHSSEGPSALANLLRKSPPQSLAPEGVSTIQPSDRTGGETETDGEISEAPLPRTRRQPSLTGNETERTPLLRRQTTGGTHQVDVEGQTNQIGGSWLRKLFGSTTGPTPTTAQGYVEVESKSSFSWKSIAQHAVIAPASCLPAVCVGLLLNILDALSYGERKPFLVNRWTRNINVLTIMSRYGAFPSRKGHIFTIGFCWDFHLLCQHNRVPDYILLWEHIQRRCGLRIGMIRMLI